MSEDKPKYTISDFTEAGIHQFVQDISSPLQDEWDKNAKKENVAYFTPVQYLLPPLNPPFPFDDKITGEHLEFPTKDEWQECPNDKKVELFHRAIDDFEAYRADYNKRVDEYFTDNGIENDIVAQAKSGVYKYEKGRSHFEFMTINHPFHYDQVDKHSHNKWKPELGLHWKKADNELVYTAIVDMDDADAIPVINKTVYDYIKAITNDRDLKEGDIYYNPMRELMRWAEVESIDFNDIPNVLQVSASHSQPVKYRLDRLGSPPMAPTFGCDLSTKSRPNDWEIEHDITKHTLKFRCTTKDTKYYSESNNFPDLAYGQYGFHYHRGKEVPRKVQLLEQYAIWNEMRKDSPKSVSLTWEDCVIIGSRHYTMKLQRDLNKHLKSLLNLSGNIFEKRTEEVGGEKFTYYKCLIDVTTRQEPKESHKKLTAGSQKQLRSGINDYLKDKKLGRDGIESGVYHYGLDDSDLDDK